MKTIIVADDFGLCEKHDEVIISLINQKKLNAVSVLVHGDLNKNRVESLNNVRDNISIGLHLNLTMDLPKIRPLGPINRLLISNIFRKKNDKEIEKNIKYQIEQFKTLFGTFPDFIDGHEHIHIIPKVLKILLKIIKKNTLSENFWIRSPVTSSLPDFYREFCNAGLKVLIVSFLGNRAKNELKRQGIKTNKNFSGFFNLKTLSNNFRQKYNNLLSLKQTGLVIMVHPGSENSPIQQKDHNNKIRALEAKLLSNSNINL